MSTVTLQPNLTFGLDTCTREDMPDLAGGSSVSLRTASSVNFRNFSLLKFDLSMLAGATITSATLYLYNWSTDAADRHFAVHAVLAANSAWTEADVTWNYAVAPTTRWAGDAASNGGTDAGCSVSGTDWNAAAMGTFTYTGGNPANTEHACSLDTTQFAALVANNYGLLLRITDAATGFIFNTSEYSTTNVAYCPKLVVECTLPDSGTLVLQPDPGNILDTELRAGGNADKNYGISGTLRTGQDTAGDINRSLISFSQIGLIPAGSAITSAVISLYCSHGGEDSQAVNVHRMLTAWFEGLKNGAAPDGGTDGSTWNHRNVNGDVHWGAAGGQAGTDYVALATDTTGVTVADAWYTWDVTADVQLFVDGTATNLGWIWIGKEDATSTDRVYWPGDFAGIGAPGLCPFITIVYAPGDTPPTAVISGPATGTDCVGVHFSASGSTDDGTIVDYHWDFGDGTTGSGVAVGHTYAPGTYTITLTVTDDGGLTDTDTATITITACTETELQVVPLYYRSTELTIAAKASILNIYGVAGSFDHQYRRELTGYQHELRADGGYYACELGLAGSQNDLEDWFENGLGRDITVYNPALKEIWNGFVNEVALELGPLSISRGPLLEVANVISGSYAPLNTAVTPPTAGARATYAAVIDTDSRAEFGPFVRQINMGQCTAAEAAQYVNSVLVQDAWPHTTHRLAPSGGNVPKITIRCAGYVRLLEAEPYIATGVTGTVNISDKLADVLAGVAFNSLWTNTAITTNTTQVPADEPTNNGRPAWEIIKGLLSHGDASYNRYTFSVGKDRLATYAVIPSEVEYHRKLNDAAGRIYTVMGDTVEPWDVRAGEWLFYPDFLIGRPQSALLRRDPRNMFLETVVWKAPEAAPTLTGAKFSTVPYQIARQGLSGR